MIPYANTQGLSFPAIFDARTLTVPQQARTQPNLSETLRDTFQKLTMVRVTKEQQQSQVVEKQTPFIQLGVVQPHTGRTLQIMKEGQRSWKWSTIHSTPDLLLNLDDQIIVNGITYRVMADKNFDQFGYVLYYVILDYTEQPALGT